MGMPKTSAAAAVAALLLALLLALAAPMPVHAQGRAVSRIHARAMSACLKDGTMFDASDVRLAAWCRNTAVVLGYETKLHKLLPAARKMRQAVIGLRSDTFAFGLSDTKKRMDFLEVLREEKRAELSTCIEELVHGVHKEVQTCYKDTFKTMLASSKDDADTFGTEPHHKLARCDNPQKRFETILFSARVCLFLWEYDFFTEVSQDHCNSLFSAHGRVRAELDILVNKCPEKSGCDERKAALDLWHTLMIGARSLRRSHMHERDWKEELADFRTAVYQWVTICVEQSMASLKTVPVHAEKTWRDVIDLLQIRDDEMFFVVSEYERGLLNVELMVHNAATNMLELPQPPHTAPPTGLVAGEGDLLVGAHAALCQTGKCDWFRDTTHTLILSDIPYRGDGAVFELMLGPGADRVSVDVFDPRTTRPAVCYDYWDGDECVKDINQGHVIMQPLRYVLPVFDEVAVDACVRATLSEGLVEHDHRGVGWIMRCRAGTRLDGVVVVGESERDALPEARYYRRLEYGTDGVPFYRLIVSSEEDAALAQPPKKAFSLVVRLQLRAGELESVWQSSRSVPAGGDPLRPWCYGLGTHVVCDRTFVEDSIEDLVYSVRDWVREASVYGGACAENAKDVFKCGIEVYGCESDTYEQWGTIKDGAARTTVPLTVKLWHWTEECMKAGANHALMSMKTYTETRTKRAPDFGMHWNSGPHSNTLEQRWLERIPACLGDREMDAAVPPGGEHDLSTFKYSPRVHAKALRRRVEAYSGVVVDELQDACLAIAAEEEEDKRKEEKAETNGNRNEGKEEGKKKEKGKESQGEGEKKHEKKTHENAKRDKGKESQGEGEKKQEKKTHENAKTETPEEPEGYWSSFMSWIGI